MASKISGDAPTQCGWCEQPRSSEKKLLRCSACLKVQYCDVECQKQAWPEHRKVCVSAKNLETKATVTEAKGTVQESEKISALRKALENATKINPNPFTAPDPNSASPYPFLNPSFYQEQAANDVKICELAMQCLHEGAIALGLEYIQKHTMEPVVRKKFFIAYARKMVELDVNNVSTVLAKGPSLIPAGKEIRRIVVDQLCLTKQFEAATACAKEEKNPDEQRYLLKVVSAGKEIAEKQ